MIGRTLGAYHVVSKLGEGGMGEVYRAHDARLRRDVAVKVLPPAFATDDDRLRRFEQEAHATAALNHPNILAVYDVGRAEGTAFVVTELLEGQTLREALAGAPLPARKVIGYAVQVASGLAAAHDKGIVHRDLKPDNLFVTTDERLKILDFGLAKVADAGAANETRLADTTPGTVLGTFGYMAPEQVRGQAVDHRADIFSFGAVLFELLTGRRAFSGETAADTMTAILKESPPDLTESGRAIPPALARVVDRCLEKNPARRFQSASDLAFALQTLGSDAGSGSTIAAPRTDVAQDRGGRTWLIAAGALVVGAAVTAAVFWQLAPAPAPPPPFLEIDVAPPPGHVIEPTSALSPDATRLAYAVTDASRRTQLWLRTLNSGTSAPIPGTDDARNPFWSPESQSIGFFAGGRLRAVNLATGRVRVVCDAAGQRTGGTWNEHGVIVFATETGVPLKRVDAKGGVEPVPLATTGVRPHFLPGGRHFLFHRPFGGDFLIFDLEANEFSQLAPGQDAIYADGYLLFTRSQHVLAQPFDLRSTSLSGQPAVIGDIGFYPASTGPNYTVAGDLIAIRRNVERHARLVWYARDGTRLSEIAGGGNWRNPSLSPDDGLIAVQRNELQGTSEDIWIVDSLKGTSRALSTDVKSQDTPLWSADGRSVLFKSGGVIVDKPLDGTNAVNGTVTMSGTLADLTPDGRSAVLFNIVAGNRDILIHPRDGSGPAVPFAQTAFNETQPALSPDGKWLAYVSDERGMNDVRDVFIQAFPGGGQKIHLTADTGGGLQPRWRRDSRELYFVAPDRRLTAVSVEIAGNSLRLGKPQALFPTTIRMESGVGTRVEYDVTRDGKRFIVAEFPAADTNEGAPLTIFVNWRTAVAKGIRPAGMTEGR